MRIDILTGVPELLESPINHSIVKRARDKQLVEINIHNLRDYTRNKQRQIDDYAFGHDAGMVLMIEPIDLALQSLKGERDYDEVIFTTPDGAPYCQKVANELSMKKNLIIICGHYKGLDQRVRDNFITREISVGDYVLTGGELAASVIIDSIVRLIPGVLSDETSALSDSFQDELLAPPVYTRPADYKGWKVPDVLLSGNAKKIEEWKIQQSIEKTRRLRPDLLQDSDE